MTSYNFSDMVARAKETGALADPPESGRHTFEVFGASAGTTKKGDPRFGIRFRVVDEGPDKGKSAWENINFIADNNQNLAISFETFRKFGIGDEFWETNPSPEQVKERILQIGKFEADLKVIQRGDFTNYRFSKVNLLGSAPAVPSAPAPAPAPEAPAVPGRSF